MGRPAECGSHSIAMQLQQRSKEWDAALGPLRLRDLGPSDPALQRTETPGGTSSSLNILL